ncbi:MAG: hypothetical protein NTZ35_04715 [Ignavibacteriales bacterium]|nr:hypothetical protein [Ignavibacteriales bacterium]
MADAPKGVFLQKVAFTSRNQGPPTLHIGDLYVDGETFQLFNIRDLVSGSGASLSPDERWISYLQVLNGVRLMRINADGSDNLVVPFDPTLIVREAEVSPEGSRIVVSFERAQDFNGEHIGVIYLDSGAMRVVYADSSRSFTPTWSPDGKRIYFAWLDWMNQLGHNVPGSVRVKPYIRSINVDGTDLRTVSDTVNGQSFDTYPSISPDGRQVAFVSQRTYFPDLAMTEIFVMNVDGTGVKRLTFAQLGFRSGNYYDAYTMDEFPRWLKNGTHILFERSTYHYNQASGELAVTPDLYVIRADGSGLQYLTNNGNSSLSK